MSQATSPSTAKPYGLARVCRVWGIARSTIYWQRHECAKPAARRGPLGPCADDGLVDHIRHFLEASPFPGGCDRAIPKELRCLLPRLTNVRPLLLSHRHGLRSQVLLMDVLPDATKPDHPEVEDDLAACDRP